MSESAGPYHNPRRIAFQALRRWEDGHRHADDILTAFSRQAQLDPSGHAQLQQLFYGVVRHLSELDELIEQLRHGKLGRDNRSLLRLGLFQLFHTRVAVHAAVNETVNLARHRRDRAVINGVLRNADRRRDELLAHLDAQPLAIRESHPEFLIERWTEHFGDDTALQLCQWNNEPPPVYLRINRLVDDSGGSIRDTIADSEQTSPVEGLGDFFRIEGPVPKNWLQRGWIYLQDPSTSLACRLLDPQPGERILDACAAPGGKASLMAASGAHITAIDRGDSRLERLGENLQRLRTDNAVEVHPLDWFNADPLEVLGSDAAASFDAILLDVPCSNTGVMRRRIDVRWRLTPEEFAAQAAQQLRITEAALPLLKPGGRLVYSTCSLEPEENAQVIERLLASHPSLRREEEVDSLPWRDGYDGAFACRLRLSE